MGLQPRPPPTLLAAASPLSAGANPAATSFVGTGSATVGVATCFTIAVAHRVVVFFLFLALLQRHHW